MYQMSILYEFARFSIMSLAFIVALYAFFAKEARLREGAERLLLVIFLIGISALLSTVALMATFNGHDSTAVWSLNSAMVMFFCGWGVLLFNFWKIYGRLYHMRQKRFWKYVPPFFWVYKLLPKRYAFNILERESFTLRPYDLTETERQNFFKGATIFILGDSRVDLTRIAIDLLVDGLQNKETGDYVCCHRPPDQVWQDIVSGYPSMVRADIKPTFIDAYSPNFGFDDEVLKEKLANLRDTSGGLGIHIISARTVAGIHTAGNTSWYINKKKVVGAGPRRPHRTVYDRLSALSPFSSVEQINNYIHHFMAAEKTYGMITIIIETFDSPKEIIATVSDLADYVIEYTAEAAKTYAAFKKAKGISLENYSTPREYVFSA